MSSEPHLGLLARFEIDRFGTQAEIPGKIRVFSFPNRMVLFWQIQPSLVARAGDRGRANLHQSGF
jgi:hypothetical protein